MLPPTTGAFRPPPAVLSPPFPFTVLSIPSMSGGSCFPSGGTLRLRRGRRRGVDGCIATPCRSAWIRTRVSEVHLGDPQCVSALVGARRQLFHRPCGYPGASAFDEHTGLDCWGRSFVFACSIMAEATTCSTPVPGPMGRSNSILHGLPSYSMYVVVPALQLSEFRTLPSANHSFASCIRRSRLSAHNASNTRIETPSSAGAQLFFAASWYHALFHAGWRICGTGQCRSSRSAIRFAWNYWARLYYA